LDRTWNAPSERGETYAGYGAVWHRAHGILLKVVFIARYRTRGVEQDKASFTRRNGDHGFRLNVAVIVPDRKVLLGQGYRAYFVKSSSERVANPVHFGIQFSI
jgi:hypothetical protein